MPQWASFLVFFIIVTSIYSAGHYYIYSWLVRWTEPARPLRRSIQLGFLLLILSFPASRILAQVDYNPFTYFLTLVSSTWMGLVLYFVLLFLAIDLGLSFLRLFAFLGGKKIALSLRSRRILAGCAALGVLLLGGVAWLEAHDLGVTRLDIPIKGLPAEMDGFTLVQVSDLHYGMLTENGKLLRVVERVNELKPDLIVITGDLVDEGVSHMEDMAQPLKQLKSRRGVLAVTGNHEYYAGVNRAAAIMISAGVEVLRNEIKVLPGGLQVLGVDDPTGARRMGEPAADLERQLSQLDPKKPSILLYHQPIYFEKAASLGVGLQLSGHTHGGQLYPIIYISRMIYPRTPGLHRVGESKLYVSRGAGTWGPPMRLGSPPEIVHITLRSPKQGEVV
jgi:predicted MPP superfamily phosphohydrolase